MREVGAAAAASAKSIGSDFKTAAASVTSSVSSLKSAFAGFVAFSTIKAVAKDFAHLYDEITNANAKIKIATLATHDFTAAQQGLFAFAQKNSAGLAETASIFARMKLATAGLGYETKDIIGVVDTLQQTFLLSGASVQEAKNGLMQFSHMMSEGKLQGRQLNSLLAENPFLMEKIAAGLGTTTGKLREYSHESSLSTKTILLAIESQKSKIDELAKNVPMTFGRAMTQMKNSLLMFVGEINKSAGAATAFSKVITSLGNHMSDIALVIVSALGIVSAALLTRMAPAITVGILAMQAAILTLFEYIAAFGVAETAMLGFQIAIAAVGGPLIILGVALATAAAAFTFLGKSAADAATKASDSLREMGDQATKVNRSVNAIKNAKTDIELRTAGTAALQDISDTQRKVDQEKARVEELKSDLKKATASSSGDVPGLNVRIKAAEENIAHSERQMAAARQEYIAKTGKAIGQNVAPTEKEKIAGAQKSLLADEASATEKKFTSKDDKLDHAREEYDKQAAAKYGPDFKNNETYKATIAEIEDRRKKERVVRPKNTGSAQQFQTSKAESKAEADKVVNEEKELNVRLKEQFEDGLITLEDYQNKRVESRKRALEAELKFKREELDFAAKALVQAKKGGNVNEIETAKGRSFAIQADIEKFEGELASGRAKFAREFKKENEAQAKGLSDIATNLADLTGLETDENIRLGVKLKLANDLLAVERISDPAKRNAAQADYNTLLEKKVAIRQYKLRVTDPKALADGVKTEKTQAVVHRVADGSITQIAADKEITAINREQAAVYEALIIEAEKYAATIGKKVPAEIEVMKTAVRGLKQVVDSSAVAINKTLSDSIGSALDGLLNRTMTFKQAFLSIFSNVAKEINKQVSGELSNTLMKTIFGSDGSKTGGIGGFFSKTLFGGEKGDKSTLGTAINPMVVTLTKTGLEAFGLDKDTDQSNISEKGLDAFGIKTDPVGAATNDFASTMQGTFSKMTDSLSGFFDGLGNTLGGLFSSTGGAGGGSQGGGGGFMSAVSGIGSMLGFAEGGHVQGPGSGTSDSIMARLSNGEFVMNARAVGTLGVDFLNGLNGLGGGRPSVAGQLAYAAGGMVTGGGSGGSGGHSAPPAIHMTINTSDAKSFQQSRGQIESQMRLMVDRSGRNS